MSNELAITTVNTIMNEPIGTRYCSIAADGDRKTAAKVFNAINNPEYKVSNYINKDIDIQDVIIEATEVISEETGELSKAPRVILVDPEGKAYSCVSMGMFNAVRNLYTCFGSAPYEPAVTVTIKQVAVGRGSMLTFDIKG